jgi:hypothetical protein
MITREFQLHIDPSLYSFKFSGANYATVKYSTDKVGDNISVDVFAIEQGPLLFCAITDRERLVREAEAAAKKNAIEYWEKQPHEVFEGIVKRFAPYI